MPENWISGTRVPPLDSLINFFQQNFIINKNNCIFVLFVSEFLLGNHLLVAPVLEKGAVSRDIYLPKEVWRDANRPEDVYFGPMLIKDYPADLGTLPFFTRAEQNS